MRKFSRSMLLAFMTVASAPALAQSGGGSAFAPDFGGVNSSSTITTAVSGPGFNYTGTVGANASANHSPGNATSSTMTGGAGVGSGAGIAIISRNEDQSFVKGPNSLSVGISTLMATQTVNGQTHPLAMDVGVAFSRATPFGSSATTAAFGVGAPSPLRPR